MVVKLSKMAHNDLIYLVESLRYQILQLTISYEATPTPQIKENLSITKELFYNLDKKNATQFPPKNTSIKLYYHSAMALIRALNNWQQSLNKVSYEANKARIYKNNLMEQTGVNNF